MLIDVLKNLGLSDKESKIYLACIELGSSVVSNISKHAGVNRVTTYDILDKLIQKGFVNYLTKNKLKYFNPVKPDLVYKVTKQKAEDLKKGFSLK